MNALGTVAVFVVGYIILMLPTYYLPYVGSNSAMLNVGGAAIGLGLNPAFWYHLAASLALVALTTIRGFAIDKKWLVIFPILALVFDLTPGLSIIPLVPTVMHIQAIVFGVIVAKSSADHADTTASPASGISGVRAGLVPISVLAVGAILSLLYGRFWAGVPAGFDPLAPLRDRSVSEPRTPPPQPRATDAPQKPQARLSLPVDLSATHRQPLEAWLRSNPKYRAATTPDCLCDQELPAILKQYDNKNPFYAAGDFNGDGAQDFAFVVVDTTVNINSPPPKGFNATLLVFSGPLTESSSPAMIARNIAAPHGAQLFYSSKGSTLAVGKWEGGVSILAYRNGKFSLTGR